MTRKCHWRQMRLAMVCAAALLGAEMRALAGSSIEPTVASFYGGQRMIMISGQTPEGGDRQQEQAFAGMTITSGLQPRGEEDIHGRLVARHMGRHIPGQPSFVVQTLPGAAGRRAAAYLYHRAARDGSVIGNLQRGIALDPLLGLGSSSGAGDDAAFDAARFGWLGSLRGETGFLVAGHAAGETTPQSLFVRDMIVGGTSPRDDSVLLARALNALTGTRLRIIAGYSGAVELQIALERGEIAGFVAGGSDIKSRLIPWTRSGQARALLQLGLERDPAFPDAPLALDFARSAADREALAFILGRQALGAPYAAPPDVPAERLIALRRAFEATLRDEEFRDEAARLEIELRPLSGMTMEQMVARLVAAPEPVRARAAQAVRIPPITVWPD